jgi:Isochorismatase family
LRDLSSGGIVPAVCGRLRTQPNRPQFATGLGHVEIGHDQCGVESTMRSGYENGYQVITLNDCVAATSIEEHDNALTYDFPMFSQPMSSTEFMDQLGSE